MGLTMNVYEVRVDEDCPYGVNELIAWNSAYTAGMIAGVLTKIKKEIEVMDTLEDEYVDSVIPILTSCKATDVIHALVDEDIWSANRQIDGYLDFIAHEIKDCPEFPADFMNLPIPDQTHHSSWEQFNALHAWMVKHVQDGNDNQQVHAITEKHLLALLDVVEGIMEYDFEDEDEGSLYIEAAKELLPPKAGFGFGPTSIDGGYVTDIEITQRWLEEEIDWAEMIEGKVTYFYQAAW